jgi:hypothetical protein
VFAVFLGPLVAFGSLLARVRRSVCIPGVCPRRSGLPRRLGRSLLALVGCAGVVDVLFTILLDKPKGHEVGSPDILLILSGLSALMLLDMAFRCQRFVTLSLLTTWIGKSSGEPICCPMN